jgi:hypothetical protein
MSISLRKLCKTSPKSVTQTFETSICMMYRPSVLTSLFLLTRLEWIEASEFITRIRLLRESDHVRSSNFTMVRDSKSSLPILKIVLYISECMKD